MENKEINIWHFFDEILKHSKKLVLMDGDVSERSLGFASSYGSMVYVNNLNNETNKSLNIICDRTKVGGKPAQGHRNLQARGP